MPPDAIVHIVDDDDAVRHSLRFQLETAGYAVRDFASAEAFLETLSEVQSGCVLTDVRMPGLSGLDLVNRLKRGNFLLPVIIMTGHGDIPLAVEAMKAGVVNFIEKPLDDAVLLEAIETALLNVAKPRHGDEEVRAIGARFDRLSPRERDVLTGVIGGKLNKVIAHDLGISFRTVEVYRAGLMTKTGASTISDLVRMALTIGL
jgi:two-component system response regulator FixJ